MAMQLRKAERKKSKLRIGFSGPSGSGKTYSALLMAYGITGDWTKIALIDTENGSGELYSHLGPYNVISLDSPYTSARYIEAIKACENAGMEAIIIDSTSHEWEGKGGCLESNELLAASKFKGNTWAAWSETTPKHQKFIEAIVTSKCHILTTARSKTETIQTDDKKIKKVGTKEIQREGFEYELTANFNIDRDKHYAIASKDRTGLFIDRDPFIIDESIGKEIMNWNTSGIDFEAMEAEKRAAEELEEKKRMEKEILDRNNLYDSIISQIQSIKFLDDLAEIWNTEVIPNKQFLGEAYVSDLVERKNAIKDQLGSPKNLQESKKTPPLPPVEEPEYLEEEAENMIDSDNVEDEEDKIIDTPPVNMQTIFIEKIRATTTPEELEQVVNEIDHALSERKITLEQYGIINSHKGIRMNKFPKA